MLEPWALHQKKLKKAIYAIIAERPTLARAACLRALTPDEADNYRHFGLLNPIAVIPNGVEVPNSDPELFLRAYPELRKVRILLYLGRIHPKKGPDTLVRAWTLIQKKFLDVQLVIAGSGNRGSEAMVTKLADQCGVGGRVTFTGSLQGNLKWSAIAASTIFVLPSLSEGFSMATLEALGSARPVVISPQCHFPAVVEHRCGWITTPDIDSLASILANALSTSAAVLEEMGVRGRALVTTRYSVNRIGCQLAEVYRWILGGPKPTLTEVIH
jgi:glycosyltransferase involved in cell wall biosynthesis